MFARTQKKGLVVGDLDFSELSNDQIVQLADALARESVRRNRSSIPTQS